MARASAAEKRVLEVTLPGATPEEITEKTQAEVEAEADIDAAAEEAVNVSQAIVSRVDASTGERFWLDSVDPKLISNKWIAEQFGGGSYEVVFKKPFQGKGPKRPHLTRRYKVDPQIPPRIPAKYHAPHPTGASIPGGAATGLSQSGSDIIGAGVLQIISSMQEASKTNAALTQAAIERLNKPGPTMAEIASIATPVVTAIGSLITAIITRPVPTPPDPMTMITAVAAITKGKDPAELIALLAPVLRPPASSDPNSVTSILSAVEKVVAIGRDLQPTGAPSEEGWTGVARAVLQAVPEVASVIRNARANGAPPANGQPVPAAVAALPPLPAPGPLPPHKPATDAEMLFVALRPMAEELALLADQQCDPELQAEAYYEKYKGVREAMRAFTRDPQHQDALLAMFPALKTPLREPWVRQFLAYLAQFLNEPA
jgi:hypothetical protein